MQSQLEGQQIGRYLIREPLGSGGVATVYRAYDQVSGQEVALKLLPPNPDAATLDRFRREALLAGALRHPHIVRVLQVGTTETTTAAYIAMDLVAGESLAALLARVGKLGAVESCLLLEPVARALAFAHEQGVIHRDVKPSNILLRPADANLDDALTATSVTLGAYRAAVMPMLSDFGIARFLDAPELTGEGRTVGTPAFMAPEQCMGSRDVDGRADIYALGAVLYRCVTGHLPFHGTSTQILHAHVFEPVVIEEQVAQRLPPKVIEIMRRALAKAPDARHPTAQALAADLAAAGTTPDATSTLTVTQIAAAPSTETSTQQVLVAGSTQTAATGETRASHSPARSRAAARRGPALDRLLWAIFFVLLIGGGGWWSINSWLRVRTAQEEAPGSMPALVFVTYTPMPASSNPASETRPGESVATATMTPVTPARVVVITPTITTMPTAVAPTSTPLPTPLPTLTPVATTELAPPAGDSGEGDESGTPAEDAANQEVAGACAMVVDEFFLDSVAQLGDDSRRDFACPTEPARLVQAEWLPFARGAMVAVAGEPLVYVYYEGGTWEQVARSETGLSGDAPAPSDLPLPFAPVWGSHGRQVLLGEPLQTEAWRGDTLVQPFMGGIALGKVDSGEMLFLARAKLRF